MKRFNMISGFLILLFLPAALIGQPLELSLQESIQIALEQNIQFQTAAKSLEIADAKLYESLGNFLPTVDATLVKNIDEKVMSIEMPPFVPGTDPINVELDFTKNYQAALGLTQPIFTGGAVWFNYKQNLYALKAEEEKYRKQKLITIFDVKKSYYSVLLTEELIKVANEALSLTTQTYKTTKALYDQGVASKFELLNSEVEMENVKPRLIAAKNSRKLSELAFKNLLQIEDKNIFLTRELEFIDRKFTLDTLYKIANELRPDLKQMEYQENQMDYIVNLSYSAFSPIVALSANYNYRKDNFNFNFGNWDDYYSVNLVLSIPIFRGTKRIFKVQQAKAGLDQMRLARKAVVTGSKLEIERNYLIFYESIDKLKTQDHNITRAEENVRIANINYEEGMITSVEMGVAQMNLIQTRIQHLQSLYEYLVSLAAVEYSVGIENFN